MKGKKREKGSYFVDPTPLGETPEEAEKDRKWLEKNGAEKYQAPEDRIIN